MKNLNLSKLIRLETQNDPQAITLSDLEAVSALN